MNKKTILSLVLIAQLYGQMSSANEVVISEGRLNSISQSELHFLNLKGAISIQNNKVVLNLQKLDSLLKDPSDIQLLADEANKSTAKFIPYGYTMETKVSTDLNSLVESLSARFVPYGHT